jgi:hypothetical protein
VSDRPRNERLPRSLRLTWKFRRLVKEARRHELADCDAFFPDMSAELALNRMVFDPEDEDL